MLPKSTIEMIIEGLNRLNSKIDSLGDTTSKDEYITAQEFLDACRMSRSTFDELRFRNEIHVIKRNRKLYLKSDAVRKYIEGK